MKKRPKKFPVKYEQGIRYITGKRTTKEAEKPFRECLMYDIRRRQPYRSAKLEERIARIFNEVIENFRVNGFTDDGLINWLDRLRNCYMQMPRHKPRKKVKKEFDANDVPKVTKKPLGPQESALLAAVKYLNKHEKRPSDGLKVPKTD